MKDDILYLHIVTKQFPRRAVRSWRPQVFLEGLEKGSGLEPQLLVVCVLFMDVKCSQDRDTKKNNIGM